MATTLLKLKELSQQTIEAIVKSPDAWKKYLNAAPNIFRYSFEDQLLIYAQAPRGFVLTPPLKAQSHDSIHSSKLLPSSEFKKSSLFNFIGLPP